MVALSPVGTDRRKARMLMGLVAWLLRPAAISFDASDTLTLDVPRRTAAQALDHIGEQFHLHWKTSVTCEEWPMVLLGSLEADPDDQTQRLLDLTLSQLPDVFVIRRCNGAYIDATPQTVANALDHAGEMLDLVWLLHVNYVLR